MGGTGARAGGNIVAEVVASDAMLQGRVQQAWWLRDPHTGPWRLDGMGGWVVVALFCCV